MPASGVLGAPNQFSHRTSPASPGASAFAGRTQASAVGNVEIYSHQGQQQDCTPGHWSSGTDLQCHASPKVSSSTLQVQHALRQGLVLYTSPHQRCDHHTTLCALCHDADIRSSVSIPPSSLLPTDSGHTPVSVFTLLFVAPASLTRHPQRFLQMVRGAADNSRHPRTPCTA